MKYDKALEKTINEIKHSSKTGIMNMEKSHCPIVNPIDFINVYYYKFNGYKVPLVLDNKQCYKTDSFPTRKYNKNTFHKSSSKINYFLALVTSGELFPMMFFVDGKFVPWKKIRVVQDKDCDYILIDDLPVHMWNLNSILLPYDNILYLENCENEKETVREIIDHSSIYFAFDSDCCLIPEGEDTTISYIVGIPSDEEVFSSKSNITKYTTTEETPRSANTFRINNISNKLIHRDAMIAYNSNTHQLIDHFEKYVQYLGNGYFIIDEDKVDINSIGGVYTYGWKKDESISYPIDKRVALNSNTAIDYYLDNGEPIKQFDFNFNNLMIDSEDIRLKNTQDFLLDLLSYDQSILNKAYMRKSMITRQNYSLKEFMIKFGNNTTSCRVPVYNNSYRNNNIMVFINGELLTHYNDIVIEKSDFLIDVSGYNTSSEIELWFINNTQNDVYDIIVESADKPVSLPGDYEIENMNILYNYYSDDEFTPTLTYPIDGEKGITYLEMPHTITENTTNYNVVFDNENYYNRYLKLCSKRQFRYQKIIKVLDTEQYRFQLDESFNYVKEADHFMVFVNHRKLNPDNFAVLIPSSKSPFYRTTLELSTYLVNGDVLEVFYLPQSIDTKMVNNELTYDRSLYQLTYNFGKTDEDIRKLNYNLSSELEMFFINGKLIHKNHVYDIQADQVIIENATSYKNINIVYHIPAFDIVNDIYLNHGLEEEYSKSIVRYIVSKYYNPEKFEEYMATHIKALPTNNASDIERDFLFDHSDIRAVINNIIMEHFVPNGIKTNEDFVFDVDATKYARYGQIGNSDIITLFRDEGLLQYEILSRDPRDVSLGNLKIEPERS